VSERKRPQALVYLEHVPAPGEVPAGWIVVHNHVHHRVKREVPA
jgi:hypothetical protein